MWSNNGHTPKEIMETEFPGLDLPTLIRPEDESVSNVIPFRAAGKAAPKTGPNDPCPCGSGKKHKYCCMK